MTGRRSFIARAGIAAVSTAAIICSVLMASAPALAAWVDVVETGVLGHLRLKSDPMPVTFAGMSPGSVRYWQVNANIVEDAAQLTLQVEREGALVSRPDGLHLEVQRCGAEWTASGAVPSCAAPVTVLAPVAASSLSLGATGTMDVALAPIFPAGVVTSGAGSFLLVTLSIPDTPSARADESLMGLEATLGLRFTAAGMDPTPRVLTRSGADVGSAILLAVGAVGLGVAATMTRRRKARP